MPSRNINYLREFFYSKYNGILAGCTFGIGLLSGHPFVLIAGVVGYALGLMFLHDSKWFQKIINDKYDQIDKLEAYKQIEEFKARRAKQLELLSPTRRESYLKLADVGRTIEQATTEAGSDDSMNTRFRKIDELIWTYLKLLTIEQSLEVFIESERGDNLPKEMREIEERISALIQEIEKLRTNDKTNPTVLSSKERLFNSCVERKDVLMKRLTRIEQANANIEVVKAEQERLQQQVKLIRADAVATRNTDSLTSRIDASVEHLGETNKWRSELNDFKDIVGDMPESLTQRVGFGVEGVSTSGRVGFGVEGVSTSGTAMVSNFNMSTSHKQVKVNKSKELY